MPLKKFARSSFQRPSPLSVTIRPTGRFSFSSEASRSLDRHGTTRVYLYGDQVTKTVVIRPAPEDAPDGYQLTFTRRSERRIRATLDSATFLRWLGYQATEPHRFEISENGRHSLEFTAMPTPDTAIHSETWP